MTSSRPGSEVTGHVRSFEGHRVEIRCSFRVLFARRVTRVYRFRWTLNGRELSSSRRVDITVPRQADLHGFWNSTLIFNPIIPALSGQLNCYVTVSSLFLPQCKKVIDRTPWVKKHGTYWPCVCFIALFTDLENFFTDRLASREKFPTLIKIFTARKLCRYTTLCKCVHVLRKISIARNLTYGRRQLWRENPDRSQI